MQRNYDSSQNGVPYTRVPALSIEYPADDSPGAPIVRLIAHEVEAVKMADGSRRTLRSQGPLTVTLDTPQEWLEEIPMVDPTTGEPTGETTTRYAAMLHLLACIRAAQTARDAAEG